MMEANNELKPLETSGINSRQDFVYLLNQLLVDYQVNNKNLSNQQLEGFLEALVAYSADIQGYYHNSLKTGEEVLNADVASWRVFADMLRGAIIYEY
ncbi:hypothetical protein [uncultured Hymenobacter sp.]|uniref:DUF7660 family protein n=1 Tax=uncultured Hymenobacter sp. TaxID=170016 RepID=UPI0035CAB063